MAKINEFMTVGAGREKWLCSWIKWLYLGLKWLFWGGLATTDRRGKRGAGGA
jgi:hypothetical protein